MAMEDKASEELWSKLKIGGSEPESEDPDLKIDPFQLNPHLVEESDQEDSDEEEFEFSFPFGNSARSPISADDAFQNGQIRPTFPLFDQSLLADDEAAGPSQPAAHEPLKKFFTAEETDGTAEEIKSTAGLGKKSNSTGSSRVWRFRDLVHRSSSDGKDAFVFLNPPSGATAKATEKPEKKSEAKTDKKLKGKKVSPTMAAHEKHYGKNRADAERRRSYLPYRPGLVGFFTNVNGLSRNVHPF